MRTGHVINQMVAVATDCIACLNRRNCVRKFTCSLGQHTVKQPKLHHNRVREHHLIDLENLGNNAMSVFFCRGQREVEGGTNTVSRRNIFPVHNIEEGKP